MEASEVTPPALKTAGLSRPVRRRGPAQHRSSTSIHQAAPLIVWDERFEDEAAPIPHLGVHGPRWRDAFVWRDVHAEDVAVRTGLHVGVLVASSLADGERACLEADGVTAIELVNLHLERTCTKRTPVDRHPEARLQAAFGSAEGRTHPPQARGAASRLA